MNIPVRRSHILLPCAGVDLSRWAVVACDQYTSNPAYWQGVEAFVGDAPSTLNLTLPEIWLDQSDVRIPDIHARMRQYLDDGLLTEAVNGFVLVERTTQSGPRLGLVAALDLEAYSPDSDSGAAIRATEGTVASRIPSRMKIRRGAPLELPHVMVLADDVQRTLVEPLYARRDALRPLYDFDLMAEGGHLRGWAVEGEDADAVLSAVEALQSKGDGLLFCMGDGNHSFAAARAFWQELKPSLPESEQADHPARYALAEIVNLNDDALAFEPIHRVLFNVDTVAFVAAFRHALQENGIHDVAGNDIVVLEKDARWSFRFEQYPLPFLQNFLDQWLLRHPEAKIDYIHGEEELRSLVAGRGDALGFLLKTLPKSRLFELVRRFGALPRKAFSMGEANEKRFYMEARKLTRD